MPSLFINTVDMVIFTCLDFREFVILGFFVRLRVIYFDDSSAIIIIIFAIFLNSRICPREIAKIKI